MTLEQLEAEVLALPRDSQVILLARLLEQLGQDLPIDDEIANVWVNEAESRDESLNTDQAAGVPAENVFRRVRASLQ